MTSDEQKWTAEGVERVVVNPVYAGINPYPAIVSDDEWIASAVVTIEEHGAERFLQLMLEELRMAMNAFEFPEVTVDD